MDPFNLFRKAIFHMLGSPAKKTASTVGLNDDRVEGIQLDLLNRINVEKFKSVPKNERILILPHCLRSKSCPAKLWESGYTCQKCGKCSIFKLCEAAKSEGYKGVFIVPGASVVSKIIRKYAPKGIVGVACMKELVQASGEVERLGIAEQVVPLLKDGCVNTLVDSDEVVDKLKI